MRRAPSRQLSGRAAEACRRGLSKRSKTTSSSAEDQDARSFQFCSSRLRSWASCSSREGERSPPRRRSSPFSGAALPSSRPSAGEVSHNGAETDSSRLRRSLSPPNIPANRKRSPGASTTASLTWMTRRSGSVQGVRSSAFNCRGRVNRGTATRPSRVQRGFAHGPSTATVRRSFRAASDSTTLRSKERFSCRDPAARASQGPLRNSLSSTTI